MNIKKQKGFSLSSLLVIGILLVFSVIGISKFGVPYWDRMIIKNSVISALDEAKMNSKENSNTVKSAIIRKISVDNINISSEDISVSKIDDGEFQVDVNYVEDIDLFEGASIHLDLSFTESTSGV